ncbi:MAG: hypothetical protein IPP74_14890 [Alphaproteobacteria bacterium]|nr:hypothetical protein [Alphaproteobacteria bacterium]
MPFLPIPLFTPTYKNADGSVLTDDAFVQYNGFIDGKGGLNIRPGEILAKNSGGRRNDGLFHWPDKNLIVSIDEGYVSLNEVDTTQTEFLVEKFPAATVTFGHGSNVTSFATDGDFVYMAAGGRINYVNSSGVIAEITDTEAPDRVTHWISRRISACN